MNWKPTVTSDNSPSRSLVLADAGALPATIAPELEEAAGYARAEKLAATRRAYQSDFDLFHTWCESRDLCVLPADLETVAAFLAAEAKRGTKPSTIARRLAAFRYVHKLAGYEPPTNAEAVKATLRGIRRTLGGASIKKAPATCREAARHGRTGTRRPQKVLATAPSSCSALLARFAAPSWWPSMLPISSLATLAFA
jgi:Phage integrase, N-terminal SAM-like domain